MPLPKRPAKGENARFTAITPNGLAWDPTEGPPSGSGLQPERYRDTERWGQMDAGSFDNSGGVRHDPLKPDEDSNKKSKKG